MAHQLSELGAQLLLPLDLAFLGLLELNAALLLCLELVDLSQRFLELLHLLLLLAHLAVGRPHHCTHHVTAEQAEAHVVTLAHERRRAARLVERRLVPQRRAYEVSVHVHLRAVGQGVERDLHLPQPIVPRGGHRVFEPSRVAQLRDERARHREHSLLGQLRLLDLVKKVRWPRRLDVHEAHDAPVALRVALWEVKERADRLVRVAAAQQRDGR